MYNVKPELSMQRWHTYNWFD